MESDVTRHLRLLREFLDRIVAAYKYKYPVYATEPYNKILEVVAATAAPGGMSEKTIHLIKTLQNVAKTSRMINERFPGMTFSSEDEERLAKYLEEEQDISALASTDEDEGSEVIQEQEITDLANTDEEN